MHEKNVSWSASRDLPAPERVPNRISHAEKDKGYRHIDKDPVLYEVCGLIEQSGLSIDKVAELSGVSRTTRHNRLFGRTRRPRNATISFVLRSLGITRRYVLAGTGDLVVPPRNWEPREKLTARRLPTGIPPDIVLGDDDDR
jgi:transcriptional regulator with XRE-family HTH domain